MSESYPLAQERAYCSAPCDIIDCDVAFIGSGAGLAAVSHLVEFCAANSLQVPRIAILEGGPFDLACHLGDLPGYSRLPFIQAPERLGGKLSIWGVSIPRPRLDRLCLYGYPLDDLIRRFENVERAMGAPDPIPESGKNLELELLSTLRDEFHDGLVSVAPLAIDRWGTRWTPLKLVPSLKTAGVRIVSRFRVDRLERCGCEVTAVHGRWEVDGRNYALHPRATVVATGVERALPLLGAVLQWNGPRAIADHHRLDFNAVLPPEHFGRQSIDEQGVAVLIVELTDNQDGESRPFHLEVKCAPLRLWREGYMQSSDNLSGPHSDETLYFQIQAVGAMKDRLPPSEFVNVSGIRPAMTLRDARFHQRIVQSLERVCHALRVDNPSVFFRPIAQNHHLYGMCTVGVDVDKSFRSLEISNLTILPPAAFFDHHCDSNPTLRSVVTSQYAMEEIAARLSFRSRERGSEPVVCRA